MMNKLAAALLHAVTGCASDATQTDGALNISGTVTDAARVSHVVATNASTGEHVVVEVTPASQGRFEISLPAGDGAWVVTFADASKKGVAMRVATLQSAGIDAFSTKFGGTLDFGDIKFDGHFAHGEMWYETLAAALDIKVADIAERAAIDDLALRYSSPDIDNNGVLDAVEGHEFFLDFAGSYRFEVGGRDAKIVDLIAGLEEPAIRYAGTAMMAGVPHDMGMHMASGILQFEQPFYGTALGMDTPMVAAGVPIGQPHIKFGQLGGNELVGVVAHPDRDAPRGIYNFGFDNGQLTFTDVYAPTADRLAAVSDYAVPFVRIRPVDTSCTTDCEIASVDLTWMKQVEGVWTKVEEPREARLEVLAKLYNAPVNLSYDLTGGTTSLPWSAFDVSGTGITHHELSYLSTGRLCYLAVSYRNELGMKMTGQVDNTGCF